MFESAKGTILYFISTKLNIIHKSVCAIIYTYNINAVILHSLTMFLPRTSVYLIKTLSPDMAGEAFFKFIFQGNPKDSQINMGYNSCLICLTEVEAKSLLLKAPCTSNTGLRGSEINLT